MSDVAIGSYWRKRSHDPHARVYVVRAVMGPVIALQDVVTSATCYVACEDFRTLYHDGLDA